MSDGDEMRDMVIDDCHDKMHKADRAPARTSSARSAPAGRRPALVEKLQVDYYGSEVPLQQLAGFSVPEPRVLVISPVRQGRDQGDREGDPGERPRHQPDRTTARSSASTFPELTEERRKELVKVVKHRAEEGRVAVRNVRRQARQELEAPREGRRDLARTSSTGSRRSSRSCTHEVIAEIDDAARATRRRSCSRSDAPRGRAASRHGRPAGLAGRRRSSLVQRTGRHDVSDVDDERPEAPPGEGVRILGAEEAQAAAERGPRAARAPSPPRRRGPPPERASPRPVADCPATACPATSGPSRRRPGAGGRPTGEPSGSIAAPALDRAADRRGAAILGDDASDDDSTPGPTSAGAARASAPTAPTGPRPTSTRASSPTTTDRDGRRVDDADARRRRGARRRRPRRGRRGRRRRDAATRRARATAPRPSAADAAARRGAARGVAARRRAREPTTTASRPTTHDGRRTAAADLPPRIITGVVVAVVALVCFALGARRRMVLATAIVGLAALELYEALRRAGYHPATLIGLLGCVAIVPIALQPRPARVPVVIFARRRVHDALVPVRGRARAARWSTSRVTLLGVRLHRLLGGVRRPAARRPTDGVGLHPRRRALRRSRYDVVGYFVGSQFGRTPLMPRRSRRTRRSRASLGGMAAVVLVRRDRRRERRSPVGRRRRRRRCCSASSSRSPRRSATSCESMLKRDLGVKDFGTLLPGPRRRPRPLRRDAVLPARRLLPGRVAPRASADAASRRCTGRRRSSGRPDRSAPRRSTSSAATATTTEVVALAAGRNAELLAAQAAEFGVPPERRPLVRRRPRRARRARRAPRRRRRAQRGRRLRRAARPRSPRSSTASGSRSPTRRA